MLQKTNRLKKADKGTGTAMTECSLMIEASVASVVLESLEFFQSSGYSLTENPKSPMAGFTMAVRRHGGGGQTRV